MTVPSVEHEQLRDLVRCREDIRADLMRARHRLGSSCCAARTTTRPGEPWTRSTARGWPRHAVRRSGLAVDLRRLPARPRRAAGPPRPGRARARAARARSPWPDTIARLRCLRGIDTLSALGLCAEIGEFGRFMHPTRSAPTSGSCPPSTPPAAAPRQGSITKAGSTHARRLLVEAAYHYRRRPGVGESARAPPARPSARDHQHRLESPTPAQRPLAPAQARRGKPNGIVAVAIARELAALLGARAHQS